MNNWLESLKVILKGAWIGGTMMIPGVSGGTMAIIMGIYDHLLSAVNSLLTNKEKRVESLIFLIKFCIGGGLGILLVARPFSLLLEMFPMPVTWFFLGAVAGGIPMIYKKSGQRLLSFKGIAYVAAGMLVLLVFTFAQNRLTASGGGQITGFAGLFVAGVISSAALILPGISVSYFLLILGLYEPILAAIQTLDILYLLPLDLGVIIGIFAISGILEAWMKRYPACAYLMILGFVLVSLEEINPGIPTGIEIPICIVTCVAGFAFLYWMSTKED